MIHCLDATPRCPVSLEDIGSTSQVANDVHHASPATNLEAIGTSLHASTPGKRRLSGQIDAPEMSLVRYQAQRLDGILSRHCRFAIGWRAPPRGSTFLKLLHSNRPGAIVLTAMNWRKLSLVTSLVWLIATMVLLGTVQYRAGAREADRFLSLCLPTKNDREWCQRQYSHSRTVLTTPYWPAIAVVAITPILIVWLCCWAVSKSRQRKRG
jgi:hypothetical protein